MAMARTPASPPAATTGRAVPVFPGLPLIGSALDLRRHYLATLVRAHLAGHDVVRFDAGPPGWRVTIHAVFHPDGVQQVLDDPDRLVKQTPAYRELRQSIGNGLLTSEGPGWLRQRRMLAPVFTRRRLTSGYAGVIVQESQALADRWAAAAAAGAAVDANADIVGLTARVIGRVLFGTDMEAVLPRLLRSAPYVNAQLVRRSLSPHPTPRWLPSPGNRRMLAAEGETSGVVGQIVGARRSTAAGAGTDRRDEDLLGLLLAARDPHDGARLSDDQISEQVLVFLLAGHETTATALTCALYELARSPEWQGALHDEVDAVLGRRPATAADVPALVLSERVVRETLRLYPSAHTIGRFAPHGVAVLGHDIPPGSTIIVSPWVTQRSPAWWPNPDRFDPTRFEPTRRGAAVAGEATAGEAAGDPRVPDSQRPGGHRYAWFPFGAGPHTCIGAQLAMLEATLALATLAQRYRFSTQVDRLRLTAGIALMPSGPVPLRLVARPA